MRHLTLSDNWQLKERDTARDLAEDLAAESGWLPASAPGCVHEALLAAGRIPDPFYGLNEREVQWVGERDWLYRCVFDMPADPEAAGTAALCCDGLDTIATVWLNGEQVLTSDNMFVPQRAPIDSLLRPGRNELRILFESAWRVGKQREATHGKRALWNGDSSRLHIRKAQYHYGWDWGPCLLTAGPWQPVRIELGAARIAELHCPAEVAADLANATLPVEIAIEIPHPLPSPPSALRLSPTPERVGESPRAVGQGELAIRLDLYAPDGAALAAVTLPVQDGGARHSFTVEQPRLWWPNGQGEQPLYRLVATLEQPASAAGAPALDQREIRFGLRRLRLIQAQLEGEPGTSFLFEVNNTPLFCGGANWIPADSFTTRITPEHYRALLQQAADMHMTMLRIWGGGIYEADVFYELCDELGLLVWQDFMFACGIYPAHEAFRASVRAEAAAQVRRLRHHPSIALWCGNNEDYQIARSTGVYDATFDGDFTGSAFPAREIYERLLPEVCAALDPTRTYWPGSPFGGADPDDPTRGDRHAWEVWKGADYHEYPGYVGRFVSEFGLAAAPSPATIESFTPPQERYPQSRTFEFHNKATDGPRRLATYLSDNLRLPGTLEEYVYATQLVQAEALALAYRGWRRRWGGPGRYACAGALVWQLDDCWPVTSWAIVDYTLRPKPACYAIRRELAPLAVGLAAVPGGAAVWAVNGQPHAVRAELELRAYALDGASLAEERRTVLLEPQHAAELGAFEHERAEPVVVAARLLVDGAVVARAALWHEPFKYLALPDPAIEVARLGGDQLRIQATRPAKGVWLAAGDGVAWSDNMLDLLPGDPQIVTARGLGDRPVQVRSIASGVR